MKRLYEKKDHLINRNRNLTSEQKAEIIELLGRHPSYENKIDWNKSNSLTYEDFLNVLRPLYINELDPRGLVEGQDYDIIYESDGEVLYSVYTYNASRILASNSVEPEIWTKIPSWCGDEEKTDEAHAFGHFDPEHGKMKPGAKWCISMQTSDNYWKQYSKDFCFFFWFRNKASLRNNRKIAIGIYKNTWQIGVVYNGADNSYYKSNISSYIIEAINGEKDNYKEKELNKIKSMFTLNPHTNRYDYDGGLYIDILESLVSEDRDGFIINFGEITGDFKCNNLRLKSLKGAPQKVGKCFDCSSNQLTSLKGAPQTVGGDFDCSRNQLTSLEGVPQTVGWSFYCSNNKLTSLKGAPKEVSGSFYCSENQLTSLEGAPKKIRGVFNCSLNDITSLEGAPQEVSGYFNCNGNLLTSLEGAPQTVSWGFYCSSNQLTTLKGAPKKVSEEFNCSFNPLTSLQGAPQEVGGSFYCYNSQLTSLEGAPKEVGGLFDCRRNPNLHSLDGIGEVRGRIYKDF